jgi:hypothetical protein
VVDNRVVHRWRATELESYFPKPSKLHKLRTCHGLGATVANQILPDPYLLFNNLNIDNNGMPQLFSNLSKNSTIPSSIGSTLFADEVNKDFYQFGGEYRESSQGSSLIYSFDAVLDQGQ